MRLGLVTAIWQRPHLTKAWLAYYRRAAAMLEDIGVDLVGAVAGSDGERSRSLCEDVGFFYVEFPNQPLGAKVNAALGLLRDHDVDAALLVGSDDWLSHDLLRTYVELVVGGHDYMRLRDLFVLDADSRRCVRIQGRNGAGRVVGRQILDALGWELWPSESARGLDVQMAKRARAHATKSWGRLHSQLQRKAVAVDVKTHTNLRSFSYVARHSAERVDPERVLGCFAGVDRRELESAMELEAELR